MLQTGDNMTALKRGNRTAVLVALHTAGSLSRKRLAESVHLTPAAITKIVSELIGEGLVREGATLPAPEELLPEGGASAPEAVETEAAEGGETVPSVVLLGAAVIVLRETLHKSPHAS